MNGCRLLVIDDEKDLLELEAEELRDRGYDVDCAETVSSAISQLDKTKYDCVLVDMRLQNVSGLELVTQIRHPGQRNYKTPIIVVSGDLNLELVRQLREYTPHVLVKPIDFDKLHEKLQFLTKISSAPPRPQATKPKKKTQALIVDDDVDLANSLAEFLKEENFNVVVSNKPPDALIKISNQRFDVILLDLKLGLRDGDWIVKQIRNDKGSLNFSTPILIMSGHPASKAHIDKVEIQGYLEKPLNFIHLVGDIHKVINQKPEKNE